MDLIAQHDDSLLDEQGVDGNENGRELIHVFPPYVLASDQAATTLACVTCVQRRLKSMAYRAAEK